MSRSTGYSGLQIALHWLTALAVVATWWVGSGMGRLAHQKIEGTYAGGLPLHVIGGLTVFALVIIRLIVRMRSGTPGPTPQTSETLAKGRHWGHIVIYVLLFAVPLGGMAVWFGGIEGVGDIHGWAGTALLWIAGLHALFAFYHQYFVEDRTLRRMMVPRAE